MGEGMNYIVRYPDDPELEAWLEAHHDPKWRYRKLPTALRRGMRR